MDIAMWKLPGQSSNAIIGEFKTASDDCLQQKGFVVAPFKPDEKWLHLIGDMEAVPEKFEFHLSDQEPQVLEKNKYVVTCEKFIEACTKNQLRKAILSRALRMGETPNPLQAFSKICDEYPFAYVYLFSSKETGTWVGASPEILLRVSGNRGKTMSLAGTRRWDSEEPWREKEYKEQSLVTGYIESVLQLSGAQEVRQHPVRNFPAGPVKHLITEFDFHLLEKDRAKLVRSLHPTPAVCGLPVKEALEFIDVNEPHHRGFYAGFSGITGADLTIWVNLRCVQFTTHGAFIYAGGGITKDSDVDAEWQETENKADTLRDVLTI